MNLWIRSQDRNRLIQVYDLKLETFSVFGFSFTDTRIHLGTYKSEGRALEVLDEIQSKLDVFNKLINEPKDMFKNFFVPPVFVYEMPKEWSTIKLGDKVKIIKGSTKLNEIYAVVSIPFKVNDITVVHLENIRTGQVKHAYNITFLEKVGD